MRCAYIFGLRVDHRTANAVELQEVLTRYGCHIKLRVGLHETGEDFCSDGGLILLQACGEPQRMQEMLEAFNQTEGVRAKLMELD